MNAPQIHSTREIVDALHQVADEYPEGCTDHELMVALAKLVPYSRKHELERALEVFHEENEAEAAEHFALARAAEKDLEMFEGLPLTLTYGEAVRLKAAAGDPRAIAILRNMNSVDSAVHMALLDAAVEAHPAWSRDGRYFLHDPDIEGPPDDIALVDWFQRTHAREAAAITRTVVAQHGRDGDCDAGA